VKGDPFDTAREGFRHDEPFYLLGERNRTPAGKWLSVRASGG
jgi:hypothetical protein